MARAEHLSTLVETARAVGLGNAPLVTFAAAYLSTRSDGRNETAIASGLAELLDWESKRQALLRWVAANRSDVETGLIEPGVRELLHVIDGTSSELHHTLGNARSRINEGEKARDALTVKLDALEKAHAIYKRMRRGLKEMDTTGDMVQAREMLWKLREAMDLLPYDTASGLSRLQSLEQHCQTELSNPAQREKARTSAYLPDKLVPLIHPLKESMTAAEHERFVNALTACREGRDTAPERHLLWKVHSAHCQQEGLRHGDESFQEWASAPTGKDASPSPLPETPPPAPRWPFKPQLKRDILRRAFEALGKLAGRHDEVALRLRLDLTEALGPNVSKMERADLIRHLLKDMKRAGL